jgi:UDP-N-acetylglucosamine--N-acetylmuramyl-(pentapeptide) pyrophosphoryl-undecaprenol N-acetylglucosamine transferase
VNNRSSILIAAGGTGGHLFPAQSLAQELVARGHEVILITDERGLAWKDSFVGVDMRVSDSATPYRRGLLGKIYAALVILKAVWSNYWLIGNLKPSFVIGFGGYPSIPPMLAAILRRVPRAIHEQNGVMGRANKALAKRMTAVAVTVPDPRGIPEAARGQQFHVGNPVRPDVIKQSRKAYPSLDREGEINLLVFGGSQGARIFSDVVPAAVTCLGRGILDRLKVHQQCRSEDLDRTKQAYEEMGLEAVVEPFFEDMPELISRAHLVVCRSGASTVSELMVIGRPAILVPLPQALDDDQGSNATFLVEGGGAWLMPQEALTPEGLADLMRRLFEDPSALQTAARISKKLGKPNAAGELASLVESLIEEGPKGDRTQHQGAGASKNVGKPDGEKGEKT